MTGAKIIAGRKSATLILVIPIKFVPIMIIRIEPTQVISLIAPVFINGAMSPARRTRPPCMTSTDTEEKSTPSRLRVLQVRANKRKIREVKKR